MEREFEQNQDQFGDELVTSTSEVEYDDVDTDTSVPQEVYDDLFGDLVSGSVVDVSDLGDKVKGRFEVQRAKIEREALMNKLARSERGIARGSELELYKRVFPGYQGTEEYGFATTATSTADTILSWAVGKTLAFGCERALLAQTITVGNSGSGKSFITDPYFFAFVHYQNFRKFRFLSAELGKMSANELFSVTDKNGDSFELPGVKPGTMIGQKLIEYGAKKKGKGKLEYVPLLAKERDLEYLAPESSWSAAITELCPADELLKIRSITRIESKNDPSKQYFQNEVLRPLLIFRDEIKNVIDTWRFGNGFGLSEAAFLAHTANYRMTNATTVTSGTRKPQVAVVINGNLTPADATAWIRNEMQVTRGTLPRTKLNECKLPENRRGEYEGDNVPLYLHALVMMMITDAVRDTKFDLNKRDYFFFSSEKMADPRTTASPKIAYFIGTKIESFKRIIDLVGAELGLSESTCETLRAKIEDNLKVDASLNAQRRILTELASQIIPHLKVNIDSVEYSGWDICNTELMTTSNDVEQLCVIDDLYEQVGAKLKEIVAERIAAGEPLFTGAITKSDVKVAMRRWLASLATAAKYYQTQLGGIEDLKERAQHAQAKNAIDSRSPVDSEEVANLAMIFKHVFAKAGERGLTVAAIEKATTLRYTWCVFKGDKPWTHADQKAEIKAAKRTALTNYLEEMTKIGILREEDGKFRPAMTKKDAAKLIGCDVSDLNL